MPQLRQLVLARYYLCIKPCLDGISFTQGGGDFNPNLSCQQFLDYVHVSGEIAPFLPSVFGQD